MKIREANHKDFSEISTLMEELGYPSEQEQIAARFVRVRDAQQDIFLAEESEEIVGMICYSSKPSLGEDGDFGKITNLIVKSKFRGLGIGKKLLNFIEDRALRLGHKSIELTTRLHRKDAHEFYLRSGYEETSKKFVKILSS